MKKDIFLSTKRSITAISTIIVFLCLIIFAIITQAFYSSRVLDNVDHQLLEQQQLIKNSGFNLNNYLNGNIEFRAPESNDNKLGKVDNKLHSNIDGKINGRPMRLPPNLIMIVYNNNIFESISNNLYFNEENLPSFSNDEDGKIITFENNGYNFRGVTVIKDNYKVEVIANIDSEMTSIKKVRTSIIGSLVILIIIAIALSAYLSSKVIKPVKEAYEKQVYFVQDASHEMRTPLAIIKGKLELLANSWGQTIDDNFEHISKMMSEIRGLEKLNSDLLLLSKEDLDLSVNITKFKLDDFINDLSEFYIDLAEMKEKKFKVMKPQEEIYVEWDYNKIKRSVIILLENAFKYTNENGEINLIIENINKYIKISVKDNGIGMNEEDQKRIFDRFYRSKEIRGKNISGTGIGLSLLKSMCKNFGIKIKVDSKYGLGTEFALIIPKVIK